MLWINSWLKQYLGRLNRFNSWLKRLSRNGLRINSWLKWIPGYWFRSTHNSKFFPIFRSKSTQLMNQSKKNWFWVDSWFDSESYPCLLSSTLSQLDYLAADHISKPFCRSMKGRLPGFVWHLTTRSFGVPQNLTDLLGLTIHTALHIHPQSCISWKFPTKHFRKRSNTAFIVLLMWMPIRWDLLDGLTFICRVEIWKWAEALNWTGRFSVVDWSIPLNQFERRAGAKFLASLPKKSSRI